MKRRHLLATTGLLAAPRLAMAQAARVLRFVPQADLSGMDPVVTTRQVVRNGALLVWDMLYGIGADFVPRPQMVEGHTAFGRCEDLGLHASSRPALP